MTFDLEKVQAAIEEAVDRLNQKIDDEDGPIWEKEPEDLRKGIDDLSKTIFSGAQAARIKELEDALVEERARWCSRENTGAQLSQAGDQFQKRCRRSARLQLQAEGKIGPEDAA